MKKGETLTFINEDYPARMVRHSITSCRAPCNGPYTVNNPFHDGRFHSGALGYMWQETYINGRAEPYWELDTSRLERATTRITPAARLDAGKFLRKEVGVIWPRPGLRR